MPRVLTVVLCLAVSTGAIAQPERSGYAGIVLEAGRAVVARVAPSWPADKAGVQVGDVITQVDGSPKGPDGERLSGVTVGRLLAAKKAGDDVALTLERGARRSRSSSVWCPIAPRIRLIGSTRSGRRPNRRRGEYPSSRPNPPLQQTAAAALPR